MNPEKTSYTGLIHAGAGTGLAIAQLGVVIPGFLPALLLTLLLAALVVTPLLALALAVTVLIGPPLAVWWLWSRRHRNAARRLRQLPLEE
jgi:Flp pilus assembly protein TadB